MQYIHCTECCLFGKNPFEILPYRSQSASSSSQPATDLSLYSMLIQTECCTPSIMDVVAVNVLHTTTVLSLCCSVAQPSPSLNSLRSLASLLRTCFFQLATYVPPSHPHSLASRFSVGLSDVNLALTMHFTFHAILLEGTAIVLSSFTTVYSNKGAYRRPPPLSRLGTGTWAALHGRAMCSAA